MNTKKIKVNIISESVFTVQGNGVDTAFLDTRDALRKIGAEVETNSYKNCDIVHIHTVGPYSLLKLLKNRNKAVVTAHVVPDSFVGSLVLAKSWLPLAKIYLRFFYNQAKAVIAVSPEVKEELIALGVKQKIYILPNSVNLDKFKKDEKETLTLRKKYGLKKSDFVTITVGQVQPRKGVTTFIKVARALPDIQFIWAGGIPFKFLAADYERAERRFAQALAIIERVLGTQHPDYARTSKNLARTREKLNAGRGEERSQPPQR
jgi:1,2-diacylglycerol-3-alpha-glucose alpha-1,2-galactosyltransferase